MKIQYRPPHNHTELDGSIQCSIRAFDESEHAFTNIVKHDPWFDLNNTRACFLDGKVVSVVQIFSRPMRIGGCVVQMGGVGSVGTRHKYRRAGYSSNVLRDSVQYMRAAGYDLSILFTDIQSHYAKAGWVMYPTYRTRLTLPERLENTSDTIIQQCDPEQDGRALREIYDCFNATRTGTIVRSMEYWNNRPKWRECEPSLFWTGKQDGEIIAYLKGSRWLIRELGYLPNHESAIIELFHHFFVQAKVEGVNEIEAIVPSECCELFKAIGCTVERLERYYTMLRIINLESLLTKMLPTFETRLNSSDFSRWEGAIHIRYESDKQTLIVKEGKIEVSGDAEVPTIDFPVSQTQLLNLLLGNMTARHVAFSNGLAFNESEIGLLAVLFPQGELFLWETDRF
jgi:predicted acetyltransferase